ERIENAFVPLLENRARPVRKARLEPAIRPRRRTIRSPRQVTERSTARDEHFDRDIRADETDAAGTVTIRLERLAQAKVDLRHRSLSVHRPNQCGNARTIAGKTIKSARCTRSAVRNGRTPLKIRPSETSGTTRCMT